MKALICAEPQALLAETRPTPARGPGEVTLRIRRVGLCGTDYHIYAGKHPFLAYPRIMGHELAGEVAEADATSGFQVGQLVTVNPYLACGRCIACRKGKPNCCVAIRVLGVHADGGMCDYLVVPERALLRADGLTLEQAAMIEFLSVGRHAVRRAQISAADRVLVVGAGPIGLAAALSARAENAAVTLMDTSETRLRLARERFAQDSTVLASTESARVLAELTQGDLFDVVMDATGNVAAMRAGLDYVAHGGRYVLISVVKEDIGFPDPEFHKRETTLLASRNALNEDFAAVIEQVATGRLETRPFHTQTIAALDLPVRMPQLIANRDAVLKALVVF